MTAPLSVNGVLEELPHLNGSPVEVEGILGVLEEGYEFSHYPKAEGRPDKTDGPPFYASKIWLAFGMGSVQPNHEVLARWAGKRVRAHGVLHAPEVPLNPAVWGLGGLRAVHVLARRSRGLLGSATHRGGAP